MATNKPVFYNVGKWLEDNKSHFLPPDSSNLHRDGQMKAFFVGGPNQRKDYHLEEGEELFYMVKGDMCLKVVEHGKFRDITIKEGEIFLLPGYIMHSPQRSTDTIGCVIERERAQDEFDGLRYFIEEHGQPTLDVLYEKWFYCDDLGTQLAPIIKGFFASKQYKTGKPEKGTITENPPVKYDTKRTLMKPFSLQQWVDQNREEINKYGRKNLFSGHGTFQFTAEVHGVGENTELIDTAEVWLWQISGESTVQCDGETFVLKNDDSLLIPKGVSYSAKRPSGSLTLICYQDPTRKADVQALSC